MKSIGTCSGFYTLALALEPTSVATGSAVEANIPKPEGSGSVRVWA